MWATQDPIPNECGRGGERYRGRDDTVGGVLNNQVYQMHKLANLTRDSAGESRCV